MKMQTASSQLTFFIILTRTKNRTLKYFESILEELNFNEFLVLYYLNRSFKRKLTQTELADRLGITRAGMTRILKIMQGTKLIKVDFSADDTRAKYIQPTTVGYQKFLQALERLDSGAKHLTSSTDEEFLEECTQFLQTISAH
ncbi:MAG TPA: MarR family transcriptional regulator [Patescibacteria group bacterium]